ncbi:MAG: mechanosensitive ion channel family protein [Anaerolineales bacterium]|nr:mechanosensitive ion channel family protein [Anaerolineales bacterium]
MSEALVTFLTHLVTAVLIGGAGYLVILFGGRLVNALLSRIMSKTWAGFLTNVIRLALLFLTIKLIVDRTGATGAFVVLVTALTGAFAIGSERLAADLVAGTKLLVLNYYKVGDLVTIAGKLGHVTHITLTNTIIATDSLDNIIIPNSEAINQIITNHSQIPGHRLEVIIPIPGDHDRTHVMRVMQEAALTFTPQMIEHEPKVMLENFGVNTQYYKVRVIVAESTAWTSSNFAKLRLIVAEALKREGIPVGEAEMVKLVEKK